MSGKYQKSELYYADNLFGERHIKINLRACRELLFDVEFEGWDDLDIPLLEERFALYKRLGGKVDLSRGSDYKPAGFNKKKVWQKEVIETQPAIDNLTSKKVLQALRTQVKYGWHPGQKSKAPRSASRKSGALSPSTSGSSTPASRR